GHLYVHRGVQSCVEFMVNAQRFRVRDIPGEVGDDIRLSLATRFVEVGFLRLADGRAQPAQTAAASARGLRLLHPLAGTLGQAGEGRVLLHLHTQVTHSGLVERLAGAVVDSELAGPEDLEGLLECLRPTRVAGSHFGARAGARLARWRRQRTVPRDL